MNQSTILTVLIKSLPLDHQIQDIDLQDGDVVNFSWRKDNYRAHGDFQVEMRKDGCLHINDATILMAALLKRFYIEEMR